MQGKEGQGDGVKSALQELLGESGSHSLGHFFLGDPRKPISVPNIALVSETPKSAGSIHTFDKGKAKMLSKGISLIFWRANPLKLRTLKVPTP